jgi:hypothetical protein
MAGFVTVGEVSPLPSPNPCCATDAYHMLAWGRDPGPARLRDACGARSFEQVSSMIRCPGCREERVNHRGRPPLNLAYHGRPDGPMRPRHRAGPAVAFFASGVDVFFILVCFCHRPAAPRTRNAALPLLDSSKTGPTPFHSSSRQHPNSSICFSPGRSRLRS